MSDIRTKICSKCKIEKPRSDFHARANRPGGLQSRCKECANGERWKHGRFRDVEHKEQVLKANRESYQRHKVQYQQRAGQRTLSNKIKGLEAHGSLQCQRCGFNTHPAALDFHHRDPQTKKFNIANALQAPDKYPWNVIMVELAKCDILCANCHKIEHCRYDLAEWEVVRKVADYPE